MVTPLMWVLLFQTDATRPFQVRNMIESARSGAYIAQHDQATATSKRDFEKRYNKLIDALQEFTQEYNASQGQVWPAKKAQAVKSALRELERAIPAYKAPRQNAARPATDKPPQP